MKTKYVFLIIDHNITPIFKVPFTAYLIKRVGPICYPLTPNLVSSPITMAVLPKAWGTPSLLTVKNSEQFLVAILPALCVVFDSNSHSFLCESLFLLGLQSTLPTAFFISGRYRSSSYSEVPVFHTFPCLALLASCFICSLWLYRI